MSDLVQALTDILTDPERDSLYSHAQLMALLHERGVPLPEDRQEAWEMVVVARAEVEMEVYGE